MPVPQTEIDATLESHARLHRTLGGLDDDTARRPSLLPDWTVGHVVTHLARNADSIVRRLRGAVEGALVAQYDGGPAGRAAEIEAGAARPAADLVADLLAADRAVDDLLGTVPADVWERSVLDGSGREIPATQLTFSRWREVETHHVDLGLGYTAADWPDALVERWLPDLLAGLPGRTDRHALTAWALGRGPAPSLRPWG